MTESMQPLNDEGMLVTEANNAWNTDIAFGYSTGPVNTGNHQPKRYSIY